MKTLARLGLLCFLAACGGDGVDAPDLARPVIEPLRMRELIRGDLDVQRDKARDREAVFDRAVGGDR